MNLTKILLVLLLTGCSVTTEKESVYLEKWHEFKFAAKAAMAPTPVSEEMAPVLAMRPCDDCDLEPAAGLAEPRIRVESSSHIAFSKSLEATLSNNQPTANDIIDQLSLAAIAFVVPATANINDTVKVQLLINPSAVAADLENELRVAGVSTSANVLISKIVVANLTAPTFTVSNITPDKQAIAKSVSTEWLWELTPLKPGIHNIHLTISAVVTVDDDKVERHIKTFDKAVTIEITKKQIAKNFVTSYWQWLWSVILVPIGLFVFKVFRKPKL